MFFCSSFLNLITLISIGHGINLYSSARSFDEDVDKDDDNNEVNRYCLPIKEIFHLLIFFLLLSP